MTDLIVAEAVSPNDLAAYLGIAIMTVLALIFGLGAMVTSIMLRPSDPTPEKLDPYESGIVPEQEPPQRFPVQFYLVSVIFIAFDIEVIFLYPWAVRMKQLQMFGFFEMLIFVVIVLIAYGYVRREGILDWAPRKRLEKDRLLEQYRHEADAKADAAAAGRKSDTEAA